MALPVLDPGLTIAGLTTCSCPVFWADHCLGLLLLGTLHLWE